MPVFEYPDGHVVLHNDSMWRGQEPSLWGDQVTSAWKGTSQESQLRTNSDIEDEKELLVVCESLDNSCLVSNENRISCGNYTETQCQDRGCCHDSKSNGCFFNSKSSPFYSWRKKWSYDSNYLSITGDTFYKKPEMACEICPKDLGWKGYHINGHTICYNKPTDEGKEYQLVDTELVII